MIFDLEEKFDIQISYNSNDPRPEFETVGDVVDAIKKLVGGKS
jgi:acyl carrier protein